MLSYPNIQNACFGSLNEPHPQRKLALLHFISSRWDSDTLAIARDSFVPKRIEIPGVPPQLQLVEPIRLNRRGAGTPHNHAALLHAITHIEFNAINLALDCIYRFAHEMPEQFTEDWLRVAREEALHFDLLSKRLNKLGYMYGDFPAHNGLWEMALKTEADVLSRMALVPRVLEARGLDATPPMINKLQQSKDLETCAILEIILRDEIGHVAIGDFWFRHLCTQRNCDAEKEYRRLLQLFDAPYPRPPFNRPARLQAGFSAQELDFFETEHKKDLQTLGELKNRQIH